MRREMDRRLIEGMKLEGDEEEEGGEREMSWEGGGTLRGQHGGET